MGRKFEVRKASMAKTQGAKSKLYAKYGKEIYVVAKNGGVDPEGNLSLRRIIEKAKKDQVPAHVIEKAIDKAAGGGGEDFVPTRYEGFGPGGCMVIADCLTDNNNRTFGDVRVAFNKGKAKLGGQGTVAHMFDHRAVFVFPHDDEDEILELLMEADVDVAEIESEDGNITVYAPHTDFFKTKTALTEAYPDLEMEVEEITFIPQTYTELAGEDLEQFEKFLELLNDVEDVQDIYHNVEMADE
ncbi:DNA-binding regulatory protein, YebC/PmpR family [Amphritea atlantica]|uniref:Probable transcriptional regulatory protein SAMN03080615_02517 n=1 Tax=Amphritea atlantica TaxID=355243 RepID=A0A1H9IEZ3_9GAMM|nr:YebC/PmpR family DNA-binding transcriptional regulator [Amphritea atlantica]SEQ73107.1 DNA-binding regulatory protein, YebC/PmpR family [Amphritea atlantica]